MQLNIPLRTASIDTSKYAIIDNPAGKVVFVNFPPSPLRLVLWKGEDYDAAGDYTQAQVDARIAELLGNDPASVLLKSIPNQS